MKYILLALLILPLSACFDKKIDAAGSNQFVIETSDGKHHVFDVEIASTIEAQRKGLMHRTELAQEAGMLFFFGKNRMRSFWMKNTFISLDMLFIKLDGTIHHIHEKAIPHDLTRISSGEPVVAVLEINGGLTKKLNIKEGDKVLYDLFAPPVVE